MECTVHTGGACLLTIRPLASPVHSFLLKAVTVDFPAGFLSSPTYQISQSQPYGVCQVWCRGSGGRHGSEWSALGTPTPNQHPYPIFLKGFPQGVYLGCDEACLCCFPACLLFQGLRDQFHFPWQTVGGVCCGFPGLTYPVRDLFSQFPDRSNADTAREPGSSTGLAPSPPAPWNQYRAPGLSATTVSVRPSPEVTAVMSRLYRCKNFTGREPSAAPNACFLAPIQLPCHPSSKTGR